MAEENREIYRALRDKFDRIGFGYTPTESGSEYVFLERFFTPEQARWVVALPFERYVTAADAAEIMGVTEDEAATMLYEMSREGQIYREMDDDGTRRYHLVPFAHGVFEFHVDRIEDEWSAAMSSHYMEGWGKNFYGSSDTPIFRTIPLSPSLVSEGIVPPEENIEEVLRSKDRVAVALCMCRSREKKAGRGCDHDLENCLTFDDFADFYVENGLARYIEIDEALDIVKRATKDGLVISMANSRDPEAICLCCGEACGLLGAIKYFPGPAVANVGNYRCVRDAQKCLRPKCKDVCAKRCPTGAFKSKDGELTFRPEQCIGCGACVPTCPGRALTLVRKPDEEIYEPNETLFDTYTTISQQRGFEFAE